MISANLAKSRRHLRPGQHPDYYGILGVAEDATIPQIEAAYWKRAREAESRQDLPLLNEAYEVLCHEERRKAYDDQRRSAGAAQKRREPSPPAETQPRTQFKLWPSASSEPPRPPMAHPGPTSHFASLGAADAAPRLAIRERINDLLC